MKRELCISRTLTVLAVFIVNIFLTNSVFADEICNGVEGRRVTYVSLVANALDARVDPGDSSNVVRLRGTLHYRRNVIDSTLRNKPVLIFNHGHEQKRGEACAIVEYFTEKGWVVFTPLRRGHFIEVDGPNVRSTGIYIDSYVTYCSRSQTEAENAPAPSLPHLYRGSGFCRPGAPTDDPAVRRSAVELDYLRQQRIDVRDAIAYVKSLPAITTNEIPNPSWKLADPKRIAIMGHSYGGGLTLMSNAFDYGQNVAIDIAGAELSWDNDDDPYWKIDLSDSMRNQKRPIFLLQAQNGKYLSPTRRLFAIGVNNEFLVQASIFPPAPACADGDGDGLCDGDPSTTVFKDIHSNFVGVPSQVENWGPAVVEFMRRYPR